MAAKKSKYDPAMCQTMVELGKEGASQKIIWSALGISKATAANYKEKYPEFAEALDLALVHSQAYWERMMLANVDNKNFNTRMVEIAVRGQFSDTYKENREIKSTVKQEISIDFNKEIGDLIAALKT